MSRRKPLAAVEAVLGTPEPLPPEAGPSQTFQVRQAVTDGVAPGSENKPGPSQTFQIREAGTVNLRPPHWDAIEGAARNVAPAPSPGTAEGGGAAE